MKRTTRRTDVETLEGRWLLAASVAYTTLPDIKDLVFDSARHRLYALTNTGVSAYDPATHAVVKQWGLPGAGNHLDQSADGRYLGVSAPGASNSHGMVFVIDLADDSIDPYTTPTLPSNSYSQIADIVAAQSRFYVFLQNSLSPAAYMIDPVAQTFQAATDVTLPASPSSDVERSADGSKWLLGKFQDRSPFSLYDTVARSTRPSPNDVGYFAAHLSADGSLVAADIGALAVFDDRYSDRAYFADLDGGSTFDRSEPLLYGVGASANELVVIDTQTMTRRYAVPLGYDVLGADGLTRGFVESGDGHVFLGDAKGLTDVTLPTHDGIVASLRVEGYSRFSRAGHAGTVRITALDESNGPATNFAGTVHLSSSDPNAVLPSDVDFTKAVNGTIDVPVTLNSIGTHDITASVVGGNISAAESSLIVYCGVAKTIPLSQGLHQAFDPIHQRLYIATRYDLIERFDLASGTMLTPLKFPAAMGMLDITPDGTKLYAAQNSAKGYSKRIWEIDLTLADEALPDLSVCGRWWNLDQRFGGNFTSHFNGVVVTADGRILCDTYELDPATGFLPTRWSDLVTESINTDVRLARTADRMHVLIDGQGVSTHYPGYQLHRVGLYDVAARTIVTTDVPYGDSDQTTVALSNDLVHFVARGVILDGSFQPVLKSLAGQSLAFAQTCAIAFTADVVISSLRAYNTTTWTGGATQSLPLTCYDSNPPEGHYVLVLGNDDGLSVLTDEQVTLFSSPAALVADKTVSEGATTGLSGSSLMESAHPVVSWEWDFDYDGVSFDVEQTGKSISIALSDPRFDGPTQKVVALRTTDAQGRVSIGLAMLTVADALPLVTVTAPAAVEGVVPTTITFGSTDVSTDPTLFWTIRWPDGVTETLPGNASSASHQLPVTPIGAKNIVVTATNKDGAGPKTVSVSTGMPMTAQHNVYLGGRYPYMIVQFSRSLAFGGVVAGTVSIVDAATGLAVPFDPFAYSGGLMTLSCPTGVTWPAGLYRVRVSGTLKDIYGLRLDGNGDGVAGDDLVFDFRVLPGDANGDLTVNFDDLLILSQNYGLTGRTFAQGNFNCDVSGKVDFDDLLLLAQSYGQSFASLQASLPVARVVATSPTTKRKSSNCEQVGL